MSSAYAAKFGRCLRMLSALPAAQRVSIRRLLPTVQPNGCKASLCFRIVCSQNYEHTDAPHPLALLPDLILTQNTPPNRVNAPTNARRLGCLGA
jgi:hypothetical protein